MLHRLIHSSQFAINHMLLFLGIEETLMDLDDLVSSILVGLDLMTYCRNFWNCWRFFHMSPRRYRIQRLRYHRTTLRLPQKLRRDNAVWCRFQGTSRWYTWFFYPLKGVSYLSLLGNWWSTIAYHELEKVFWGKILACGSTSEVGEYTLFYERSSATWGHFFIENLSWTRCWKCHY